MKLFSKIALLVLFGLVIWMPNAYAETATIRLTWTAPGDDDSVGTATAYDLRSATVPITEDNWDHLNQVDNEPVPQVAGSAESLIIYDMPTNTMIYFGIKTVDEAGNWSELSNIAQVTTSDKCAPRKVENLVAEEIE